MLDIVSRATRDTPVRSYGDESTGKTSGKKCALGQGGKKNPRCLPSLLGMSIVDNGLFF